MPAIWRNPSSRWKRGPRRSNRCRAACAEAGRRTARRGRRRGQSLGQGVSRGRHGRVAARKQERRPGRQASDATGSGRRRRRGPAPQGRGAGTGERGDAGGGGGRRKRPGRRPMAPVEQGEDAAGRPSAPDVFARPDDMLARHRAGQPPTTTTPGSGLTDTPGRVSGRPGRSPLPGAGTGTARSRPRSEPASRRRRPAGSWPRMVRRRMFPNDAGTAHTRARPRRLPAASPTAISRPRCRTGNGPRTSPGIRAGDGKGVPLAAGRLPRRPDRRVHGRVRPQRRARRQDARQGRGDTAGGSVSLGAFRPRMPLPVTRMAGAHGPLRPDTVDGRQGPFPGRRRRGGVPRTHEDGIRPSRALGGAHPQRGARPGRRLHPLARPRAHQTAARLDESGAIPSEPGNGCVTISKKKPAAPPFSMSARL